ncbi:hypothetical protein MKS88_000582 [Plasmodium brasilianum]|uniref:Uncharacterized protein n=1 Tax=Plasmodium brasilianum TaxID=5824 RepID=A0ACB9YG95_PLABR|nr:hypothetical protein MKS88_000582 [Plasmodium brasilianum]
MLNKIQIFNFIEITTVKTKIPACKCDGNKRNVKKRHLKKKISETKKSKNCKNLNSKKCFSTENNEMLLYLGKKKDAQLETDFLRRTNHLKNLRCKGIPYKANMKIDAKTTLLDALSMYDYDDYHKICKMH